MNIFDHLNVLAFTVLYPAYVFFTYKRVQNDLIENKPGARLRDYKETISWLWLLFIITIANWISADRFFNELRLEFSFSWVLVIIILSFAIAPLLFLLLFQSIRKNDIQRESIKENLDSVNASEFLPRTKNEFMWFILLSMTAGICEELLFRGYLIWYFESFGNTIYAIAMSSILFGTAHSYQGVKGVLRTGTMGLILALILVWTDSLLILIFLHIAGDVYGGILGWLGYGEDKGQ